VPLICYYYYYLLILIITSFLSALPNNTCKAVSELFILITNPRRLSANSPSASLEGIISSQSGSQTSDYSVRSYLRVRILESLAHYAVSFSVSTPGWCFVVIMLICYCQSSWVVKDLISKPESFLLNVFKILSHRFYDKSSYCRFHIYSQVFEIVKQVGRNLYCGFSFISYRFIRFHIQYLHTQLYLYIVICWSLQLPYHIGIYTYIFCF
jgi:hypothetical protein